MLRTALLWCGALLVFAGVIVTLTSHSPAGLGPAGFSAIMVLAILFERRGYKRIVDGAPGPDWQKTGERFRDPNTDMPVEVYFRPETGERIYTRRPKE